MTPTEIETYLGRYRGVGALEGLKISFLKRDKENWSIVVKLGYPYPGMSEDFRRSGLAITLTPYLMENLDEQRLAIITRSAINGVVREMVESCFLFDDGPVGAE